MRNLSKLTRPQILKMDKFDLLMCTAQYMDWQLKLKKDEVNAPDYVHDLNDTFDVVDKLTKEDHVLLLEFPSPSSQHYIMRRYLYHEGEWIIDSVEGSSVQEVILRTALLANMDRNKQKRSIQRSKI